MIDAASFGPIVTTKDVERFLMSAQMQIEIDAIKKKGSFGVYVGRLCPCTQAHHIMAQFILDAFGQRHLLALGSVNTPLCFEVIFTYLQRVHFVSALVPGVRIAPLPDFPGDNEAWLHALFQLITLAGVVPEDCVFIGGAYEDLRIYEEMGLLVHEINRYRSGMPRISGTEARDTLIELSKHDDPDLSMLNGLIDPAIQEAVMAAFKMQWNLLRKQRW